MKTIINNQEREVIITRKRSNKNTYLRVKEDLNIYITTNYYTSLKEIEKIIKNNINSIEKMSKRQEKKQEKEEKFYYLGKEYDIVYLNCKGIILGADKVLIERGFNVNKWFLNEAKKVFKEPYPLLTIRKMKTRWGVCNVRVKRVTLNLELIKKDIKYLDYVIAHELSHLIHPNHSKEFWSLVEKVIPNYRLLRKEMREYE